MNLYSVKTWREITIEEHLEWKPVLPEYLNNTIPDAHPLKIYVFEAFIWKEANDFERLPPIVFYPQAFYPLADLLISGGNQSKTVLNVQGEPNLFRIYPTHVDCGEPYPTYASIAQHRPADLHFFKKFADADFYLVTQTFVDRVKATGVRGLSFVLRWDGERSYPLLPKP
jgi:hypothetical protein